MHSRLKCKTKHETIILQYCTEIKFSASAIANRPIVFSSSIFHLYTLYSTRVCNTHMKKGTQYKWDSHVPREAYLLKVFQHASCADPESFVRGGPTLQRFFYLFFFFSLMRGRMIQIPLLAGHLNGVSLAGR